MEYLFVIKSQHEVNEWPLKILTRDREAASFDEIL